MFPLVDRTASVILLYLQTFSLASLQLSRARVALGSTRHVTTIPLQHRQRSICLALCVCKRSSSDGWVYCELCVCVCLCMYLWKCVNRRSPVWFEAFWNFSAKVPGSSFDGWPYLDISEASICSDLSQKKKPSLHSRCVCVLYLYVCVHACYGLRACSAGATEKQFLSDSITTASQAGGATRG